MTRTPRRFARDNDIGARLVVAWISAVVLVSQIIALANGRLDCIDTRVLCLSLLGIPATKLIEVTRVHVSGFNRDDKNMTTV